MENADTTEGVSMDDGAQAQPDVIETTAPAEALAEETQPTPNGEVESADADENVEWLRNKGIDPSDPEAIRKAAQLARNTEREFHKTRQETSAKLKDVANEAVITGNPNDDTVRQLIINNSVRDFKDSLRDEGLSKAEINEIDAQMAAVVSAKPHLAGDLEAAYALVRRDRSREAIAAAEARGREAAKAEIARASSASAPRANASGSVPSTQITREVMREKLQQGDTKWLRANEGEINRLAREGKLT